MEKADRYIFDGTGAMVTGWLNDGVWYYLDGSGTLQDGRVGIPLSHGCVRLEIANAKWIYDNIPAGTHVVVY